MYLCSRRGNYLHLNDLQFMADVYFVKVVSYKQIHRSMINHSQNANDQNS